ncbi:hypothetical protein BU16DRAFT_17887 [Lophium mytilinum]|uniref:Uncharacterized protein n=1 Tax=Lophium mytilinum TaxID=390894 RepID=A0A6A6RDT9_9PEZI|nr:hypothetical protein BU16DRAFT_17887 [Lophium mytilinum]
MTQRCGSPRECPPACPGRATGAADRGVVPEDATCTTDEPACQPHLTTSSSSRLVPQFQSAARPECARASRDSPRPGLDRRSLASTDSRAAQCRAAPEEQVARRMPAGTGAPARCPTMDRGQHSQHSLQWHLLPTMSPSLLQPASQRLFLFLQRRPRSGAHACKRRHQQTALAAWTSVRSTVWRL